MKKGPLFLSTFLVLLILSSFLVIAVGEETPKEKDLPDQTIPAPFQEKNQEDIPDPEVPEKFQKTLKVIFKLDQVEFREVIMMSALLLLAIIIIYQGLSIGLENKLTAWSIAIILGLIASASGVMVYAVSFWKSLGNIANIPEKLGVFWTGFGIIILIIIFFILKYLKKTMKETGKVINAEKTGFLEGLREARTKIKARFS